MGGIRQKLIILQFAMLVSARSRIIALLLFEKYGYYLLNLILSVCRVLLDSEAALH